MGLVGQSFAGMSLPLEEDRQARCHTTPVVKVSEAIAKPSGRIEAGVVLRAAE
jgi:hypothetical protein